MKYTADIGRIGNMETLNNLKLPPKIPNKKMNHSKSEESLTEHSSRVDFINQRSIYLCLIKYKDNPRLIAPCYQ